MIASPNGIAVIGGSLLVSAYSTYAAVSGIDILRRWDRRDPSEEQLRRERRSYLTSAVLSRVMLLEFLLLVMFLREADSLHEFFTGAMCAAGTLAANDYGYLTLALLMAGFVASGLWLVVNHADQLSPDFPLIRFKHAALLFLAPLLTAQTISLISYFAHLDPEILVSCCGALFGHESEGFAGGLAHLPASVMIPVFWTALMLTILLGAFYLRRKQVGFSYAIVSMMMFPLTIAAIVSFICLYVYHLPNHHCPFCLLKGEYGYLGYPLYLSLFAATVTGVATGVLRPFRTNPSLIGIVPTVQQRLCSVSLASFVLFGLAVSWIFFSSSFSLHGF